MIVPITLADSVHRALNDVATARGESVTSFLESLAYRIARGVQGTDEVALLWALGFTDKQIAFELGRTNHSVAQRRQRLRLPANRTTKQTVRRVS